MPTKLDASSFTFRYHIEKQQNKMAIILNIEAATNICSVSLSESGENFFNRESHDERSHAQVLAPFVEEAINTADSRAMKIDAVALSCGPGSYTGLRIASSTAKGVCYGRNIPLIAIPTTKIMAVPVLFRDDLPEDALLCPMIDARRNEVYTTIYDRALNTLMETRAEIVTSESFVDYLDKHCHPLAKWMMPLSERAWLDEKFEDIAYFEPFYLKNFIATKSKDLLKTT